MLSLLIAIALTSTSGIRLLDDKPIEVEVLEINKYRDVRQIILWRWQFLATGHSHHVAQWWTIGDEEPLVIPHAGKFLVYSKGKTFLVRSLLRTETPYDPEMKDREILSSHDRTPYFHMPFYTHLE